MYYLARYNYWGSDVDLDKFLRLATKREKFSFYHVMKILSIRDRKAAQKIIERGIQNDLIQQDGYSWQFTIKEGNRNEGISQNQN